MILKENNNFTEANKDGRILVKDEKTNSKIQKLINKNKVFESLDKTMVTLFNEPSLGLYYTEQHVRNSIPPILNQMVIFYFIKIQDKLYENRKKINNTILDLKNTELEIKEITSLNQDFSFKMLTKINSLNFALSNKLLK